MRTSLVAIVAVSLVGCVVGEIGGPGADDDGTGGSGDTTPLPRLDVTPDRTALSTELGTSNMVTVTLTPGGGFSGSVALAASAVDAGGAAIAGWTVTLDRTALDVAAGASATAVATVKIPTTNKAMTGTIKVTASSSVGTATAVSTVTVANQITYAMTLNGAMCVYPVAAGSTTMIAQGTKVRWVNNDLANRITIHIGGVGGTTITGFNHEPDPGMAPGGGTYEQTASSASGTVDWYCHNRDASQGIKLTAVP
jgi:hypothetical protein